MQRKNAYARELAKAMKAQRPDIDVDSFAKRLARNMSQRELQGALKRKKK